MHPRIAKLLFWRKPDDRLREFAETEAFGARDLARAAEQAQDPWIRRQLIRHAQDEVRHARLLDEQVTTETPARGLGASMLGEFGDEAGVDLEQMGEIDFIAFVHIAEKKAVDEFELHKEALGEKGEFFDSILQDEKRHIAWTGHALDKFRAAGRGDEVDAALKRQKRNRFYMLWMWFARRISLVMSTLILSALYFGLLMPFKLLAGRFERGWRPISPPRLDRQF